MVLTSEKTLRRISNSEVSSWLTCPEQYRFAYDLKLEKIPTGKSAKDVGICAHEGFQAYNRARVAGADHQEAIKACDQALMKMLITGEAHQDSVFQAKILCSVYFAHYGDEWAYFEVIDAERSVELPISEEFSMPLRYDLYYVDKRTGKHVLSDYKTTYDFWPDYRIKLSPQFPKYFAAFRANDMPVDVCRLDQIRTRWKKVGDRTFEELFKRTTVVPSRAKIRAVLQQHILTSQKISEFRALPDDVRPQVAVPSLHWSICQMCDYKSLCAAEMDGLDDVSKNALLATEYRTNSYDYNPEQTGLDIRSLM